MTEPAQILLQALVGPEEQAAVERAAELFRDALGADFRVEVRFPAGVEAIDRDVHPCLVLTSLLGEADAVDEPWSASERRLGAKYADLTADARVIAYVLTVFRHIPGTPPRGTARARLVRIRRLNLLAAELSRTTGVFVVDVDRMLADIGGAALATDHRLGGPLAAGAVGQCIAGVMMATGLDDVASIQTQERAAQWLARQPVPRLASSTATAVTLRPLSTTAPSGARRGPDGRPDLFLRALLARRIPVAEAIFAVRKAIARRGVARSLAEAFGAVRRMSRRQAQRPRVA